MLTVDGQTGWGRHAGGDVRGGGCVKGGCRTVLAGGTRRIRTTWGRRDSGVGWGLRV